MYVYIYVCIYIYTYIYQTVWNAGMLRNTETAKAGMSRKQHAYLPNPNDLPANVQTLPHPPSQPSYLTPIPLQPPFPHYRMFKTLACKKGMLSPLSECYSDGQGSLSGLLSPIKTC
jgi:hypothetical protein